jgi:hypothetical protein
MDKLTPEQNEAIEASRKLSRNGIVKTFINVPYRDKDEVRSKGARWEPKIKKWYFRGDRAKTFARWLT